MLKPLLDLEAQPCAPEPQQPALLARGVIEEEEFEIVNFLF